MRFARKNIAVASFGMAAVLTVSGTLLFAGSQINTRVIPKGTIEISTQYNKYLLGEEIKFTIKNNFNSTIFFKNTCPTEPLDVFRYENNSWNRLHATTNTNNCSPEDRIIIVPANGTKQASLANWQSLFNKPGTYRIVAYVDYYNQLPYTDFEIIEKPNVPQISSPNTTTAQTKKTTATNTTQSSVPSSATSSSTPTTSTPQPTPTPTPTRISKSVVYPEGTINVEYTSTYIYVISIQPASGYTYEGGQSGSRVQVTFKRSGNEAQITLTLSNGQLKISYED